MSVLIFMVPFWYLDVFIYNNVNKRLFVNMLPLFYAVGPSGVYSSSLFSLNPLSAAFKLKAKSHLAFSCCKITK